MISHNHINLVILLNRFSDITKSIDFVISQYSEFIVKQHLVLSLVSQNAEIRQIVIVTDEPDQTAKIWVRIICSKLKFFTLAI